ncbi:MAG: transcriptional regulator [bacterium]
MIFRAMADVGCRMILESLARGEAAVQDFTARFEILHPTVSRLATALVSGEHNGRHLYYHVVPRGVHRFMDWIMPHRTFWSERVNHLEQLLRTVDQ